MTSKRKRRVPQCARCRCHNIFASVRGHKRQCQWKDCTCAKCLMVTEKRRVTAVRVAVLRRERKRRMSYRMGMNTYHVGLPDAWGMMEHMPADQSLPENRIVTYAADSYYNEMLHMKYRGMLPRYENTYRHICPRNRSPRRDQEPSKNDSGIKQNLESFQHEYESLMRKLGDDENELRSSLRASPDPHRVCFRSTSPRSPVGIYRSSVVHGPIYHHPRLPHQNHIYHPMMLNTPLTLTCPCPVKSPDAPYPTCM